MCRGLIYFSIFAIVSRNMTHKDKRPKILVVVGATASGKSAFAVQLALHFSGEIISADSRQVYRNLDIGTAKTTKSEMQNVPHHLIDVCDIDEIYTAMDFKRDASLAISSIHGRGHLPIVSGGTFFYIDVLLNRISPAPVSPNWKLREELEKKSVEELAARLEREDAQRFLTVDRQNKRRLIRALEIINTLDYVPLPTAHELPYQVLTIAVKAERDDLRLRYQERAEAWLKQGFKEEVLTLLEKGVSRERLREIGFEYKLMLELIDKIIDEKTFIQKFIEKNWQYAKRQLTWLKKEGGIRWVKPDDKDIFKVVEGFLKNN